MTKAVIFVVASDKIRLRVVVTYEYDADPKNYGSTDPLVMADIDANNYKNDPTMLMCEDEMTVEVFPVGTKVVID